MDVSWIRRKIIIEYDRRKDGEGTIAIKIELSYLLAHIIWLLVCDVVIQIDSNLLE